MTSKSGISWGDDDDEDYLPPRQETSVDLNGVKTVTEYMFNNMQQKVKVTTKVKVYSQQSRINRKTFDRRKWPKFGLAQSAGDENKSCTIKSMEDIMMETPRQSKEADESGSNVADSLAAAMERTRRRNALRKQGLLDPIGEGDLPPTEDDDGRGRRDDLPGGSMGGLRTRGAGKYVPPSMREGGGGGGGGRDAALDDRDNAKIRVTNISEDTSEGDLRELFGKFGKIYRVYLAMDQETQQSRGFAFVSFAMRADAEKAMVALQGYGYDHLILKLEWARPSSRDIGGSAPGGGGLSGMRVSGYGEKLAQDTKEKVSYASNLTK